MIIKLASLHFSGNGKCYIWCFCSKTCLSLAISRIKLLQNKRDMQLKLMRKEIAQFLQTGQEQIARIRVPFRTLVSVMPVQMLGFTIYENKMCRCLPSKLFCFGF